MTTENEQLERDTQREFFTSSLRRGVYRVTFTKVNGEQRVMRCTLNQTLIPEVHTPKGVNESAEQPSLEVIRVFDLEANGWRSFRIDSVQAFEPA